MGGSSEIDVDPFGLPKKPGRRSPKSYRLPAAIERGIEAARLLWRAETVARGEDPDTIKESQVVNRLLLIGLGSFFQGVLKDAGLKDWPVSDAEWESFDRALGRHIKKRS